MIVWITAALTSGTLAGLLGLTLWRRAALYGQLSDRLSTALAAQPSQFLVPRRPPADFSRHIISVANFLPADQLEVLRQEVERLTSAERSYVPTHKKGGTVSYASLIECAPAVIRFYHSEALRRFVSETVGLDVKPTPLHDQSSLSILVYDRPGDHIDWHYDHNFYLGRHFTVLLPVVNTGTGEDGLSHARLTAKICDQARELPTPPNTLVLFEGAKVLHKASPIAAGERRVLISMTFCSDPRATLAQAAARRIKDTAFFGIRALWT